MKVETKYSVYKHTSPEGKIYIGCTSLKPTRRWDNGNGYKHRHKEFYNDIKKFGWNNFTHEIVASGLSADEGYALETDLIRQFDTTDPDRGYNKSIGGRGPFGCVHDEEFRRKRSAATSGTNNPMYGKPCTEERRQKISEAHKGLRHTEESIEKMRKVHSKRVLCVETGEVYSSVLEAAKTIGAYPQNISAVCCGKQKTCAGYKWMYI
jgi:group I intron endonuclease